MQSVLKHLTLTAIILSTLLTHGFSKEAKDMFPQLGGWELSPGDVVYTPENLWDIINGAADLYLSYDFRKLYTAEYTKGEDARIRAFVFEHSSPVNAFGIYSQERNPDYESVETGTTGFKSENAYYFITGPYYVQLSAHQNGQDDSLEKLARSINQKLGKTGPLPPELNWFPEDGKLPVSEKYIARNFLGYDFFPSAFVANYKKSGESFSAFIISPKNEQESGKVLKDYFDFAEYPEEKRNQKPYTVNDPYNGPVLLSRKGKYLFGIIGGNEPLRKEYFGLLRNAIK